MTTAKAIPDGDDAVLAPPGDARVIPATTGIIQGFMVLAALEICGKGLGFTATVAVIKHYGATAFGAISFAQSLIAIGLMTACCGLDVYAVKKVASIPTSLGKVASTVIALRLVFGTLVYGLLIAIAAIVPAMHAVSGLISVFGLTLLTGAVLLLWVPQATHSTHVLGVANLAIQGMFLGAVAVAIHLGLGPWGVPASVVVAEVSVAVGLLMWTLRTVGRLERPMPLGDALRFAGQAAPIGGSQILRALALGSDVLLVGLLLALNHVGWYSGAYKLYLFGVSLVATYCVILRPYVFRRAAESIEAMRGELVASLRRTIPVALIAIAFGVSLAPQILTSLFDPTFAAATTALRLLMATLMVSLVNAHLRTALIARNQQRQDLWNVANSSMAHVVSKLALIPTFGIVGAATGHMIGEIVLLVFSWRSMRRC